MSSRRSAREGRGSSKKDSALERLKASRAGGRGNKYEIEDDDLFDEIDEDEYNRRKAEDGLGFVVGGDYEDDEEEEDYDSTDKTDPGKKKKTFGQKIKSSKITGKGSIKNMFAKKKISNLSTKKQKLADKEDIQDDLNDILGTIDSTKAVPSSRRQQPRNVFRVGKVKEVPAVSKSKRKSERPPITASPVTKQVAQMGLNSQESIDETAPEAKKPKLEQVSGEDQTPASPPPPAVESDQFDIELDDDDLADIEDCDFEMESDSEDERKRPEVKPTKEQLSVISGAAPLSPHVPVSQSSAVSNKPNNTPEEMDDGALQFYWLDAYEDRYNSPGEIWLTGKVCVDSERQVYESCCVKVKNIMREVYCLIRESCDSWPDAHKDVEEWAAKRDVAEFRVKAIEDLINPFYRNGKYFQDERNYMLVRYSAKDKPMPEKGFGKFIQATFNGTQSPMEAFLMRKKVQGPCYMKLTKSESTVNQGSNFSWCQHHIVLDAKHINVDKDGATRPPPILTLLTLHFVSVPIMNADGSRTGENEIVGVCGLSKGDYRAEAPPGSGKKLEKNVFDRKFYGIVQRKTIPADFGIVKNRTDPSLHVVPNERVLLEWFLNQVQKVDPDIIIGHNLFDNHFELLLKRAASYKMKSWSKLGRLRKNEVPNLKNNNRSGYYACIGRNVCDLKISAKELMKVRSPDLQPLWNDIIGSGKGDTKSLRREFTKEYSEKQIIDAFGDTDRIFSFVNEQLTIKCKQIYQMVTQLQAIPLAFQITAICGNVLSQTFSGGRSTRNEYLLLHAFYATGKFMWPDKRDKRREEEEQASLEAAEGKAGKKGTTKGFVGGLVLEPKKGFYDKCVLLLDFNSLYPSIIQEYNICFTSVDQNADSVIEPDHDTNDSSGILPIQIKHLVDTRRAVKKAMSLEKRQNQQDYENLESYIKLDIRQKALKLTANSMYGCLGFSASRFYAKELAALVTRKGREALMRAKELAEGLGLDVIYGDTDSIMIYTNSNDNTEVQQIGFKVKMQVNKMFKLLEIDLDGIFKSMLLLKKKKYAALTWVNHEDSSQKPIYRKEMKGLDIVRRDWCILAKQLGEQVVDIILQPEISMDDAITTIREKMTDTAANISSMKMPLFIISKELAKPVEAYPAKTPQAHVMVARRKTTKFRKGDVVPYIICKDGTDKSHAQRAYHPEEIEEQNLEIDYDYYLSNQIHPVVSRLCEPIEGLTAPELAECLGLDASYYRNKGPTVSAGSIRQLNEDPKIKYSQCTNLAVIPNVSVEPVANKMAVKSEVKAEAPVKMETDSEAKAVEPELAPYVVSLAQPSIHAAIAKLGAEHQENWEVLLEHAVRQQILKFKQRFHEHSFICDEITCGIRLHAIQVSRDKKCPLDQCSGVLAEEYSAHDFYTQLLFYRYLFTKELKTASNHQRPVIKHILDSIIQPYINQNAYDKVSAKKIFSYLRAAV